MKKKKRFKPIKTVLDGAFDMRPRTWEMIVKRTGNHDLADEVDALVTDGCLTMLDHVQEQYSATKFGEHVEEVVEEEVGRFLARLYKELGTE